MGKGDVSACAHAFEGRLCRRRSPGYRGGRQEKMGQKSEVLTGFLVLLSLWARAPVGASTAIVLHHPDKPQEDGVTEPHMWRETFQKPLG